MGTVDPSSRISVSDIMQHPWYKKGVISPDTLKKTMTKRRKQVDEENRRLRVKKERATAGIGEPTVRALDHDTKSTEVKFDPEGDELPSESHPPSIILAMEPEDEKDGKEDDPVEEDLI